MKRGFTLIEIIIVIIIVGILAAVGLNQYSSVVEKSRIAEAKIRIGTMRQLAYGYYLNNGTVTGITNSDVGVDNTSCASSSFYSYEMTNVGYGILNLSAYRCSSGGKPPNTLNSYRFYLRYRPGSAGEQVWHCYYLSDSAACFGYPGIPCSTCM
ncbi:MAG: prepilin-type N-terminal cleavage/methylation domain-containing protein [Candidatus Omnitrophica bacterium]|nr:prepilin-type N-terminal cleavage/methylation domain-containing protein [Candidatus Omnitrophota bacterium]